jgi:hypothetical protein
MPRIFVSYRRADSMDIATRICERLATVFGTPNIIRDIDVGAAEEDRQFVVERAFAESDAVLLIIGPQWPGAVGENIYRALDDPDDYIHLEVAAALQRSNGGVIPVLVNGAEMPNRDDLPADLRGLTALTPHVIQSEPHFNRDLTRLIERLKTRFEPPPPEIGMFVRVSPEERRQLPWTWISLGAIIGVVIAMLAVLLAAPQLGLVPTPTPTATATATATQTLTPSDTPTITQTPTPTQTYTQTPTRTLTFTATPSLTPSPTETLTPTRTPTDALTNTPQRATSTPRATRGTVESNE